MKKLFLFLTITAITLNVSAQKPQNNIDSVSYSLGIDIANDIVKSQLDTLLTNKMLVLGLQDGLNKNNYKIHPTECQAINRAFFEELQKKQQALQAQKELQEKQKYEADIIAGKEFLAKNKTNPGVIETASGLQYKVIKEGNGKVPTKADKVTVHYKGTLIDGSTFDSSYDRGQPATFAVTGVIPGFSEALLLMSPGAHYIAYLPQNLAYGERGAGGMIKPYSTLIFEIEMISIPTQIKEEVAPTTETKEPVVEEKTKEKKSKKSKKDKE